MSRITDSLKEGEPECVGSHPEEHSKKDSINRRDTKRAKHQVPLLVSGSDADKQPFRERTDTLDANDGGCLLPLAISVVRGQRLLLVNMRNQDERECRVIRLRKRARGKTEVGVEFLCPAPEFWDES
jgi:hypothetical protein